MLAPILVQALKELNGENLILKSEIEDLENRLDIIEMQLGIQEIKTN